MDIVFLGHSSFKLRGKTEITGQTVTVVFDPFDPAFVGLSFSKVDADIVTVSHGHPDHNYLDKIAPGYFLVDGPGEYEVKGVSILGYSVDHDEQNGQKRGKSNVYVVEIEGYRIAHLGDLGRPLSDHEISEIGVIDVLFLPVGGGYTLSLKEAREVINKVSPAIAVPMHFLDKGVDSNNFGELLPLDKFLELCQGIKQERLEKLSINSKISNEGEPKIVILQRKV